jgi:hypothetical protein
MLTVLPAASGLFRTAEPPLCSLSSPSDLHMTCCRSSPYHNPRYGCHRACVVPPLLWMPSHPVDPFDHHSRAPVVYLPSLVLGIFFIVYSLFLCAYQWCHSRIYEDWRGNFLYCLFKESNSYTDKIPSY